MDEVKKQSKTKVCDLNSGGCGKRRDRKDFYVRTNGCPHSICKKCYYKSTRAALLQRLGKQPKRGLLMMSKKAVVATTKGKKPVAKNSSVKVAGKTTAKAGNKSC
jgi:hypothetical protein